MRVSGSYDARHCHGLTGIAGYIVVRTCIRPGPARPAAAAPKPGPTWPSWRAPGSTCGPGSRCRACTPGSVSAPQRATGSAWMSSTLTAAACPGSPFRCGLPGSCGNLRAWPRVPVPEGCSSRFHGKGWPAYRRCRCKRGAGAPGVRRPWTPHAGPVPLDSIWSPV